jgi:hypothetical protein
MAKKTARKTMAKKRARPKKTSSRKTSAKKTAAKKTMAKRKRVIRRKPPQQRPQEGVMAKMKNVLEDTTAKLKTLLPGESTSQEADQPKSESEKETSHT